MISSIQLMKIPQEQIYCDNPASDYFILIWLIILQLYQSFIFLQTQNKTRNLIIDVRNSKHSRTTI